MFTGVYEQTHARRGAARPADLVLDVAGLCVAARATDYIAAHCKASGRGRCTADRASRRLRCGDAGSINGIARRAKIYDDTFEGARCMPTP